MLSGKVGIVDNEDRTEDSCVAGDSFFPAEGASLIRVIYETVREFYMTAR